MTVIVMTAAVHFLIGIGLGCIFTFKILLPAFALSIFGTWLVGLTMEFNVMWPIIISVILLQVGYVAGSFVSSLIAVRFRVRSEDGIMNPPHSPSELAAIWALRHLRK